MEIKIINPWRSGFRIIEKLITDLLWKFLKQLKMSLSVCVCVCVCGLHVPVGTPYNVWAYS